MERGEVPDFHAFRHQFVSQLIAAGMPVEDVADLIGDTPKTVLTTYRQAIDNAKRSRTRTSLVTQEFGCILAADDATSDFQT